MNASASLPPREDAPDAPSKTKRKRDMHALQDLGVELVALGDERSTLVLDLTHRGCLAIVALRRVGARLVMLLHAVLAVVGVDFRHVVTP